MNKSLLSIPILVSVIAAGAAGMPAPTQAQELSDATLELMRKQIRRDKFDHVLPQAMRDHGVDMWIHVIRDRNPDGLASELGGQSGAFIFTDLGGERIERAILGHTDEALWGDETYDILLAGDEAFEGDPGWPHVIGEFVAARDPERIAVNFSGINALADGISHTDFQILVDALGEEYAGRIVSAEHVIGDFLAGIVAGQIALAGYFGLITTQVIDEEFAKIEAGVTTLAELDGNVFVRDPDGNENNGNDYVLQPGDIITILNGAGEGLFVADLGGNGYVLREGETGLPPHVQKIWSEAMDVREILRANIRIGPTAGETLQLLIGSWRRPASSTSTAISTIRASIPRRPRFTLTCMPRAGGTWMRPESRRWGQTGNGTCVCRCSTASPWSTWCTCPCRSGDPGNTSTSLSTTAQSSPRAASNFPTRRIRECASSGSADERGLSGCGLTRRLTADASSTICTTGPSTTLRSASTWSA